MIDIFGHFILETDILDKKWSINFEHLKNTDTEDKRLEIRFIGGNDYSIRKKDINETIENILTSLTYSP